MRATFAAGDRVTFSSDPVIPTDGDTVSGAIISVAHGLAIIRPDALIDGTIAVTTRDVRDIAKET